ncbi:hypothetical protein MLD38_022441 [Melastoma candidum]|uniref:Uncharacterized protein n=1 Tax=Melastoma candidum TaxID=119954 RepID=A0ACB9QJ95_9MYRT|nr:hypothetical protein MLD38_022441 [Melastoma candidum]
MPKDGTWQGSPWRMLQIMCDEPDAMKDKNFVSPWQVEAVAHASPLHPAFHPVKKLIFPTNSGSKSDGDMDLLYPWNGSQARRIQCIWFIPLCDNAPLQLDNFSGNMLPKLDSISPDLNKGSSQPEMLLADSLTDNEQPPRGERVHRGAKAARVSAGGDGSFQLFGQIIHLRNPGEGTLGEEAGKESSGLKGPSGADRANPLSDLSLLSCVNGLNNGITEGQMLNHVVL